MPCDSVATVACKLVIDHEQMVAFPHALELLKSLLGASDVSTEKYSAGTYVHIGLNGETYTIAPYGRISGGSRYNTDDLGKVKAQVEKLSQLVLVEIAKAKIQALSRQALKEQYLPDGTLFLTVDL
jgi:hypothetical protein